MKTDGKKHQGVRAISASLAAQGASKTFTEAFIHENTTVFDQNTQNLIDSAFEKFAPINSSAGAMPASEFEFVRVDTLEYRPPDFLIDGLIETETLSLMFGDPGCGKSFLAVDVALSLASGTSFHGRNVKQGPVFFIAGEGHQGLVRRFHAWSKDRNVPLEDIQLFKSERAAQFLDSGSAQAVTNAVQDLAIECGPPALIIIDTLARNFGSGDENSTRDMSDFVAAIDNLKAHFSGCTVLIVHHTGHADKQRARGAMALTGALDIEYRVHKEEQSGRILLTCTKMKDAEPPPKLSFEFKQVELSETTSAVLTAADIPKAQNKLTKAQALAFQAYLTAAAKHSIWKGNQCLGIHLNEWRGVFYEISTADSADAKRKAYDRARKALVEQGHLEVFDDHYLVTDEDTLVDLSFEAYPD